MGLENLKKHERDALQSLKEALQQRFSLIDFILYGSKARGTNSDESDMDVMIALDKLNPEIESIIYDILFDINIENDTFISVLIFDKRELTDGPMSESPIIKEIKREGIPV